MMQTLKPQAVPRKIITPKPKDQPSSTTNTTTKTTTSNTTNTTTNNNNSQTKRTLDDIYREKMDEFRDWSKMISQFENEENKVFSIPEEKQSRGEHQIAEQMISSYGKQIKDDITASLKAPRTARSIFSRK